VKKGFTKGKFKQIESIMVQFRVANIYMKVLISKLGIEYNVSIRERKASP
jgi:hypothetical protein